MNGVKRSETRIRSLSAAAHACHLPPLEMRYKSPLRNKFMNTLAAFRAASSSSSVRSFLSLLAQAAPILSYLPILLGTFGKFLNRPNHGVQRSIGRRSGGRSDQPHILGRSPIGSPLSLSLSLSFHHNLLIYGPRGANIQILRGQGERPTRFARDRDTIQ